LTPRQTTHSPTSKRMEFRRTPGVLTAKHIINADRNSVIIDASAIDVEVTGKRWDRITGAGRAVRRRTVSLQVNKLVFTPDRHMIGHGPLDTGARRPPPTRVPMIGKSLLNRSHDRETKGKLATYAPISPPPRRVS